MQFISGKFGLDKYVDSTGSLGVFDIDGDYKIKFVVTGAGPSNTFEIRGRIQGQDDFVVIDTVVSNATKTIKVEEYDFLEIVCTIFSAVQTRIRIAGSGFDPSGMIAGITGTTGTPLEDVSNLTFTSLDSSVVITTTAPNKVDIRAIAGGGYSLSYTADSGMVTSKSLTLISAPSVPSSIRLTVVPGIEQEVGVDFSISGTLVSWSGLGMDGLVEVGDEIKITYK